MNKLKDVMIHDTIPTKMGGIRVTAGLISKESVDDGTLNKCIGLDTGGKPVKGASADGGMQNPMTAANDIIVGGSSGTPTRLSAGSAGQVLKITDEGIAWDAVPNELPTAPDSENTYTLKLVAGVLTWVLDE